MDSNKDKELDEEIKMDVDEAFEKLKELTNRNNKIAEPVLDKIMKVIKESIDENSDFSIEHAYNALGKAMMFLSQAFCKDEEDFNNELNKSYNIAMNKIIPAIQKHDEKVEFDHEDYSLRRVMMAVSHSIDIILWDLMATNYSEIRQSIEEEEAKKATDESKDK